MTLQKCYDIIMQTIAYRFCFIGCEFTLVG